LIANLPDACTLFVDPMYATRGWRWLNRMRYGHPAFETVRSPMLTAAG